MTLRRRMTVLAAATVALAICVAAVAVYVAVRGELRGQVDDALRERAGEAEALVAARSSVATLPGSIPRQILIGPADGPGLFAVAGRTSIQLIDSNGEPQPFGPPQFTAPLPVSSEDASIARSGEGEQLSDAEVGDEHYRVVTVGVGSLGAVQIARSLEGTDNVLTNLRTVLVIVMLGGIALAALVARWLANRALAPITELTETAEHISETEDLSQRIAATGEDEVGRLASRFNSMLATLEGSREELAESVSAQRQLVADASHELRTPVASLRTDIEVLRDQPGLAGDERRRMLGSIDTRIEELGALITDVIELARGDQLEGPRSDVRLDRLVAEAVERMRRHAPEREFELELSESVVEARPDRLARAVNNLLDNAVKFSNGRGPIEVTVADGGVSVRDHGPGIPAAELDRVFDRFHRGAGVRDVPGSGLGLAIVKQVAEAHGGSVRAANAPDGGAMFELRLPEG